MKSYLKNVLGTVFVTLVLVLLVGCDTNTSGVNDRLDKIIDTQTEKPFVVLEDVELEVPCTGPLELGYRETLPVSYLNKGSETVIVDRFVAVPDWGDGPRLLTQERTFAGDSFLFGEAHFVPPGGKIEKRISVDSDVNHGKVTFSICYEKQTIERLSEEVTLGRDTATHASKITEHQPLRSSFLEFGVDGGQYGGNLNIVVSPNDDADWVLVLRNFMGEVLERADSGYLGRYESLNLAVMPGDQGYYLEVYEYGGKRELDFEINIDLDGNLPSDLVTVSPSFEGNDMVVGAGGVVLANDFSLESSYRHGLESMTFRFNGSAPSSVIDKIMVQLEDVSMTYECQINSDYECVIEFGGVQFSETDVLVFSKLTSNTVIIDSNDGLEFEIELSRVVVDGMNVLDFYLGGYNHEVQYQDEINDLQVQIDDLMNQIESLGG